MLHSLTQTRTLAYEYDLRYAHLSKNITLTFHPIYCNLNFHQHIFSLSLYFIPPSFSPYAQKATFLCLSLPISLFFVLHLLPFILHATSQSYNAQRTRLLTKLTRFLLSSFFPNKHNFAKAISINVL